MLKSGSTQGERPDDIFAIFDQESLENGEKFYQDLLLNVKVLNKIRNLAGLSQSQAAELLGVSQPYYSKLEASGTVRINIIRKLLNLCQFELQISAKNHADGSTTNLFSG